MKKNKNNDKQIDLSSLFNDISEDVNVLRTPIVNDNVTIETNIVEVKFTEDEISVHKQDNDKLPYIISFTRNNGGTYGSMCLSVRQLSQIVDRAAELLGMVYVNPEEYEDYEDL